jgi:hypothetical protein
MAVNYMLLVLMVIGICGLAHGSLVIHQATTIHHPMELLLVAEWGVW